MIVAVSFCYCIFISQNKKYKNRRIYTYTEMTQQTSSTIPEVVVVGSCNTDFFFYTKRFPKNGETIMGTRFCSSYGGKGANQCVAAAKLGASVALVARVGDDDWGSDYLKHLKEEGVDINYVQVTPNVPSGSAQITVTSGGNKCIIINPGANEMLSIDDVLRASQIIENTKVLVLQLETPVETSIKAMKLCKGFTIMNAAPAITDFDPDIMKLPSLFCVNRVEAETFTEMSAKTSEEAMACAKQLLQMGCQRVIVTLGPQGCVYAENKDSVKYFSAPQVEAVDCTGAGDCFVGTLAFMLSRSKNYPMEKAIEVAIAVASDSVMKPGAQSSYPDQSILGKFKL